VWRKLKDLGVAQVGDGLVALPHDARTKEQLEWVAAKVLESDGEAIVWTARPASRRNSRELAQQMSSERSAEYAELLTDVAASTAADQRTISKWRRTHRRIERRDHFRADGGDRARLAIDAFARNVTEAAAESTTGAETP
jgi:hypothetical protein